METQEFEELDAETLLFKSDEVPGGLAAFLPKWFEVYERHRSSLLLTVNSIFDRRGPLDNQFLNIVQGAEIYHRLAVREYADDPATHARRQREILDAVAADVRDWLKEKLRYSNSPILADRLGELLTAAQPVVRFRGDPAKVASRIAATRVFLTHRADWARERAASSGQQVRLMRIVWFAYLNAPA